MMRYHTGVVPRYHTGVVQQFKAKYSVELIDVAYPGRICEPVNNEGESVLDNDDRDLAVRM